MPGPVAVLDANVLLPISLTDFLLRLAEVGLFRPLWSADIHAEWTRNLARLRPDLTADRIDRRRRTMDREFPEAVVAGYEPFVGELTLPDPDDRHVLAVAVCGGADEIVTFNTRDFPADRLAPLGLAATHPDDFLLRLLFLEPALADPVVRGLVGPAGAPGRADAVLAGLDKLGLTATVARMRAVAGV